MSDDLCEGCSGDCDECGLRHRDISAQDPPPDKPRKNEFPIPGLVLTREDMRSHFRQTGRPGEDEADLTDEDMADIAEYFASVIFEDYEGLFMGLLNDVMRRRAHDKFVVERDEVFG